MLFLSLIKHANITVSVSKVSQGNINDKSHGRLKKDYTGFRTYTNTSSAQLIVGGTNIYQKYLKVE